MSSSDRSTIALTADLQPAKDFPAPTLDHWRELAQASLGGRSLDRLSLTTADGVQVKVLYTAADQAPPRGLPGSSPFARGTTDAGPRAGVEACQILDLATAADASAVIREEVAQGIRSFWLHLRGPDEASTSPGRRGVRLQSAADLVAILDATGIADISLHLAAGDDFMAAAALLAAARTSCGDDAVARPWHLGADPLAALAGTGQLAMGVQRSLAMAGALARWCHESSWHGTALAVSALPYHEAGASVAQELAYAIATAVDYLRACDRAGFPVDSQPAPLRFIQPVGRDFFTEIARLRALRGLWDRVMEACGAPPACRRAEVHSVSSFRCLSTRDPYVNLLRVTVATAAAAIGGADTLTTLPFDSAIGPANRHSRRLASNTQTILREESHLNRVADPAGGCWYVEQLTEQLMETAWDLFQDIEAQGGMAQSLLSAQVQEAVGEARQRRLARIATRRDAITGVSSYPNLHEKPLPPTSREPAAPTSPADVPDAACAAALETLRTAAADLASPALVDAALAAAAAGARRDALAAALADGSEPATTTPLPVVRDSAGFEALRDRTDRWAAQRGQRPSVFLARLGTLAEHKARADFAANFVAAAGIEPIDEGGRDSVESLAQAFAASGAPMAVLCSSDERYQHDASSLAGALKERGAHTVILAGNPGEREEEWRRAGIDHFIYVGCNMLETLGELLRRAGVNHE